MPKSSSFGVPSARHQDVARLEVAVDHQALVGVLHGRAHLAEQHEPLSDGRERRLGSRRPAARRRRTPSRGTAGRPRWCRRRAAARCSDDPASPGCAAPRGSAASATSLAKPPRDHLDRDLLLERGVGALGQVDDAHPAAVRAPGGSGRARCAGRRRAGSEPPDPPPRRPLPRRRSAARPGSPGTRRPCVGGEEGFDLAARASRRPRRPPLRNDGARLPGAPARRR